MILPESGIARNRRKRRRRLDESGPHTPLSGQLVFDFAAHGDRGSGPSRLAIAAGGRCALM